MSAGEESGPAAVTRWRKKPAEVEAIQVTAGTVAVVADWVAQHGGRCEVYAGSEHAEDSVTIGEPGDYLRVHFGQWLIRDETAMVAYSGFIAAAPEDFAECYEPADERRVVMAPGIPDLVAAGNGPLLDPDCRDGKHASCMGAPCECPVPGVHSARHDHERTRP